MGVRPDERFTIVENELIDIGDGSAGSFKDPEGSTVSDVVQNSGVPSSELLIAPLPLAGIAEDTFAEPAVVIPMLLAGRWVREHENVLTAPGGGNTSLPSATKFAVKVRSLDALPMLERPGRHQRTQPHSKGFLTTLLILRGQSAGTGKSDYWRTDSRVTG
jgi:hypothetical protein